MTEMMLFAQLPVNTIGYYAMALIVIAAIIGIVIVIIRVTQVNIPAWIITILWILLAAAIGILAVKFLLSLF